MTVVTKYLYGHTSPETAYVVEDYPWGFRLRTTIRYWVESKERHGQRFVSQTKDPRTGKWCAPKPSTYDEIVILALEEKGHIFCTHLNINHNTDHINSFKEKHLANLDEFQKSRLKRTEAYNNVMQHVTFSFTSKPFTPVSLCSNDPEEIARLDQMVKEEEERESNNSRIMANINKAVGHEMAKLSY